MTDSTPATAASGCTDEHAKFCSDCTTARLYNSIHCQDCPEGRPSAATTTAARQHVESYRGVCDCEAVLWLEVENVTRSPAIASAARCPNCMSPVTLALLTDDD